MKLRKLFMGLGIISCLGVVLMSVESNERLRYNERENEEQRARIEEIYENGDDVTREFVDKLLQKENPEGVEYRSIESDDGEINYERLSYYRGNKNITIDGSYGQDGHNNIFIRKDQDSIWLDFDKGLYYSDNKTDYDLLNIMPSNPLYYGELQVLRALELGRKVEKIENGYKTVIDDELNYGYAIYDDDANCVETYLDNSKGRVTTKLIKIDTDVEAIYDYYYSFIDLLTETDDISNIKG